MKKPEFDQYADDYSNLRADNIVTALGGNGARDFYENKALWITETARRNGMDTNSPLKLLDYGCGKGDLLKAVLEKHPGWELAGADISEEMLKYAKTDPALKNCRLISPTPSNETPKFDIVLIVCVLHHIPPSERVEVIKQAAGHLRPNGLLLMIEHNPLNPITQLVVARCPFDKDAQLLTRKTGEKLMVSAGLELTGSRYIVQVPPKWTKPLWVLETLLGFSPTGGQHLVIGKLP